MIRVSDHALLQFIQRVRGIDLEPIRAEIAAACAKAGDAPCVRAMNARFLIRNATVVTTIAIEGTPPSWGQLCDLQRFQGRRR